MFHEHVQYWELTPDSFLLPYRHSHSLTYSLALLKHAGDTTVRIPSVPGLPRALF